MVCAQYGKILSGEQAEELFVMQAGGVSLYDISAVAQRLGFRSYLATVAVSSLPAILPIPLIAHIKGNHFVVLYKMEAGNICLADPARGRVVLPLTSAAEVFGDAIQVLFIE